MYDTSISYASSSQFDTTVFLNTENITDINRSFNKVGVHRIYNIAYRCYVAGSPYWGSELKGDRCVFFKFIFVKKYFLSFKCLAYTTDSLF